MSTRIREFRKRRGMTLDFLAKKVGTTAQTIQRLETENMTVSLDWLRRIAEVFGIPAAALLVTDTTASVPVLGTLDAGGELLETSQSSPAETLSMVVASPNPIAVRLGVAIASFPADTVLIANKIAFEADVLLEGGMCLVGPATGGVLLRRVTANGDGVILAPLDGRNSLSKLVSELEWVAPLTMAVRYF